MMPKLCVALAVCFYSLSLQFACAGKPNDEDAGLTRWAEFSRGGPLLTSRSIGISADAITTAGSDREAAGRLLISSSGSSADDSRIHQTKLWVLGAGSGEQQQKVYSSLQEHSCQLLHSLPGAHMHWLVRCDAAAVKRLLEQHEHVTVAELPASHKRSESLDVWGDGMREAQATSGSAAQATAASASKEQATASKGQASAGARASRLQDLPPQLRKYLWQHERQGEGHAPVATLLVLLPQMSEKQVSVLQASVTQHISGLLQQQQQQGDDAAAAAGCEQYKVQPVRKALRVTLCMQLVSTVAELLSQQPEVTWVDLEPRMVLHDLFANAVGQAPQQFTTHYPAPDVRGGLGNPNSASFYPYWQAGIDGTGEVVGVVDSGLDLDSCYVADPTAGDYRQNPNSVQVTQAGDMLQLYTSSTHRKLAQYVFYADTSDDTEGHGTHVATAIVGAPYGTTNVLQSPDQATGVAPGARVALFDVGSSYNAVEGLPVYRNGDPAYNIMYDVMQLSGARIMSNSWGTLPNVTAQTVAAICSLMDDYASANEDMLFVFAAGNQGTYYRHQNGSVAISPAGTVSAPGSCKNMLTVGATGNWMYHGLISYPFSLRSPDGQQVSLDPTQFLPSNDLGTLRVNFPMAQAGEYRGADLPGNFLLLPGFDSSPFPWLKKDVPLVEAVPADACSPLDPSIFAPYSQPVAVVFSRPASATCSLSAAANNVLANPNVAGALMYFPSLDINENDPFAINASQGMDGKPGVLVGPDLIDLVQQQAWAKGVAGAATITWVPPQGEGLPPIDNVAEYSSYGAAGAFQPNPTASVVMKPDIVAPGYTLAAASDGKYTGTVDSCEVLTNQGTSMATPQVSGGALLARQYFRKGFYPTGEADQSAVFEPSGTLLKAVLIAGTAAMQGTFEGTNQDLAPPPDRFQGFGRMDLASSLPLANDELGWSLQVVDQSPMNSGDTHTYIVDVVTGKPLIVTMVFADLAAHPNAASGSVNDLDVAVVPAGGGTAPAAASSNTIYPNGLRGPDPNNNVEKIYIGNPTAGQYQITVTASYVQPGAPQNYSLVVLGGVSSYLNSSHNPAPPGTFRRPTSPRPTPLPVAPPGSSPSGPPGSSPSGPPGSGNIIKPSPAPSTISPVPSPAPQTISAGKAMPHGAWLLLLLGLLALQAVYWVPAGHSFRAEGPAASCHVGLR